MLGLLSTACTSIAGLPIALHLGWHRALPGGFLVFLGGPRLRARGRCCDCCSPLRAGRRFVTLGGAS